MRVSGRAAIVWIGGGFAVVLAVLAGGLIFFHRPLFETASIDLARHDVGSAFHRRRLNVLVVGDQADEETTDTIVLVHLDLDRRTATLMSIPRDQ
jgi:anionic cell wall polymer biosynthesis LytR-Cps2A-Psr (LCP) family protein